MNENKQGTELALSKEGAMNSVMAKIETLSKDTGIALPNNYSSANAINSAWLKLQDIKDKDKRPALEVCTKNSITETLYNMVLQGLNPIKDQCYFIIYGNKLTLMKSYLGNIAATKRLKGVVDVVANIIYSDDIFTYEFNRENGRTEIKEHKQEFKNIDNDKIIGAYAIVILDDQENYIELMTLKQIQNAWNMSRTYKPDSKTHNDFKEEMCKKTVINRACKHFAKTSDDSDALINVINETLEYDEKDIIETTHNEAKEEIKEEANKGEIIDIEIPTKTEKVIIKEESEEIIEGQQNMLKDNGDDPF